MPQYTAPGKVPKRTKNILKISYFGGVDLSNQPSNVDKKRSCYAPNMIRDTPGKIRKRTGYFLYSKYTDRINALFQAHRAILVHTGDKIYEYPSTLLYTGIEDEKSVGITLNSEQFVILDGKEMLIYDGTDIKPATTNPYSPTITVGKAPDGGGVTYEPINMLNDERTDSFLGTAGTTNYSLSSNGLSAVTVTAKKMTGAGTWTDLVEGTDFSVNRSTGVVTFNTAPGASPVTGEDNVKVTYSVSNQTYKDNINSCTFGITYGAYGATDRLFISGSMMNPNRDYYSAKDDATYFGDVWYSVIGQSETVGFSIINDYLATHKKNDPEERNIILRFGEIVEEKPDPNEPLYNKMSVQFKIKGIIQGEGAIAPFSFGFSKEPLFLTSRGVYAATPYEFSTERYVQNRSVYINGALLDEPNLEDAYATIYQEFYMLAINGKVYILDTLELSYEKIDKSRYQYECYHYTDIPARVLTTLYGELYFGTDDGEIMKFFTDVDSIESYMDGVTSQDEGKPIKARWDFDFSGEYFYRNKRIRYIAVRIAPSVATSINFFARVKNVWRDLLTLGGEARFFSYSLTAYSKWAYGGDNNPRSVSKKIKIKKVDSTRFSLRNEFAYEPFGIFELALEFTESGYYRG